MHIVIYNDKKLENQSAPNHKPLYSKKRLIWLVKSLKINESKHMLQIIAHCFKMADIQKKLQGDIDKYEALQKGWDICLSYY